MLVVVICIAFAVAAVVIHRRRRRAVSLAPRGPYRATSACHMTRSQPGNRNDARTFSHSRLETFDKCPRAYELKYLRGEEEAFGTIETFLGRKLHESIEWAYASGTGHRQRAVLPALTAHFDRLWLAGRPREMRIVKRNRTLASYQELGHKMLRSFWTRVLSSDRSETLGLEHRFTMKFDDGACYTGVIDRIARSSTDTIELIDYKTGRSDYIDPPGRSRQLQSYATWAFEEFNTPELTLRVEDLRGERRLQHRMTISDREEVRLALQRDMERVGGARVFPPRASVLCGWCGYRPSCREGTAYWGR